MSLDLVSKSLELEDGNHNHGSRTKKKRKQKSNNALDIIKSDRQGIWKELRKVQRKQQKEVIEKRKRRPFKSAIEMYHEKNTFDNTERNIEALMRVTELGKVKTEVAEKILYQQPCRLSKDIINIPKPPEERSVFTEEDFEKFAKEYDP